MFDNDAEFGARNLYIVGMSPIKRRRFFLYPRHSGEIGSIKRASMNFPIQSANADVLKIALIMMFEKIITENLPVKLHLPVHDEVLSSAEIDFIDEWVKIQEDIMIKAATIYIDEENVKVDTKILKQWTK
jgi:DNA polymerase-1